jgi:phosphatidylinositol alpha-1,6-mannosyltransferase
MKLGAVLEHRFAAAPDGSCWTPDAYSYEYWDSFHEVFDFVSVIARAAQVPKPPPGWRRVDGPGVSLAHIPTYIGPIQFIRHIHKVRLAMQQALEPPGAILLRTPGTLSNIALPILVRARKVFGVHVVGDPAEVFGMGGVGGALRGPLQAWFAYSMRRQCQLADVAMYVTKDQLQGRYPSDARAFVTQCSDVVLPSWGFADVPPRCRSVGPYRLIAVGSLEQKYKGFDVLISALGLLRGRGRDVSLDIVGDGRRRRLLEKRAMAEGLTSSVRFAGRLPGPEAVREKLRTADVFVLPSRTEGLPRALLEAMAVGLPCVATKVGGVPELLPLNALVSPGDAQGLAGSIDRLLSDVSAREQQGARNLGVARAYGAEVMRARKLAALSELRHRSVSGFGPL